MPLLIGEAEIYLGEKHITKVNYRLNSSVSSSGHEQIQGSIVVPSDFTGFDNAQDIYRFVASSIPPFNFWVKTPHPSVLDRTYQIAVAPP